MRIARLTALFLTLGLVIAVGFGATAHSSASSHGAGAVGTADDTAFVAQPDALQSSAARLERDHRRESVTSQRWTKHPLMLLAVVAAVLGMLGLSIQRARAVQRVSRPLTSWWFRSGGRAPPLFQLSVV